MKKILFAAASLFTLSLFGCAVDSQSTGSESTTEALGRSQVVGVGHHCGGFTSNPSICDHGLKCVLSHIPDVGGTCQYAEYAETCGGFSANAVTCDPNAGLQCSHVDANGNIINPDLPGVCLEAYGASCGGFSANAKACAGGLACSHVDANGNIINPDLPGVCLEGLGSACGGNMTTAKACAGALTCQGGTRVGDVGGTCQ